MTGRRLHRGAVALLALAIAGCGSDSEPGDVDARTPDEEAILRVVDSYERATREGDAELFCDQVLLRGNRASCERLVGRAMSDSASDLATEEKIAVSRIQVHGATADVEITDDGERYEATFVKTPEGWRFRIFD
jgi:hypothetical protein